MLAVVRLLTPALASCLVVLTQSACLVTVFVKDAAGDSATGTTAAADGLSLETGTTFEADAPGADDPAWETTAPVFDLGEPDALDGQFCLPQPESCDGDSEALDHALGLNCPGGIQTEGPLTWTGPVGSRLTIDQPLGITDTYLPVEGARQVVLSTGYASHVPLDLQGLVDQAGCPMSEICPSTDFPDADLLALPPPLDPSPQACPEGEDPSGAGDCSETVLKQWSLGGDPLVAYDYTDLRFRALVPSGTLALGVRFAFLTAEYPPRLQGGHNDLFVAWIVGERWSGNFALDAGGYPIAAETFPYTIKSDPLPYDCEPGCPDTPLRGFAFEGHAGTAWMPSEVPVEPGETVEVVFALFDVGDPEVDSAVLLDGVHWVCSDPPTGGTPPGPGFAAEG